MALGFYAEAKYANLIAGQGWAVAVFGDSGSLVAAAYGRTPWWAEGIHAAELWALLNAVHVALPGNCFCVDCKAVQLGAARGQSWANAPSRKFGRA